jgi:glycosyltransferase involved in cell wall biosynthesis
MRILHVVTAFPRRRDDVITPWLVELLRRLRTRGFEVEVFTSAYRGGGNEHFDGIPVHRFRYFPARFEDLTHDEAVPDRLRRGLRYRLAVPLYVLCGMVAIWRLCRRQAYDVVHVHWAMPHLLFGWVARAACRARLVTTFYGVELRWTEKALGPLRWLLVRAARSSGAAVAISRHTAEEVHRLTGVVPEVIPYGVGLQPRAAATSAASGGPFTVLFVGRLVERKGVRVLLEAMARIEEQVPVRAVIVGDGPERASLEAYAAAQGVRDRVTFRGRLPPEELDRTYAAAQALVLPAVVDRRGDTEGLGVVLLEAMSYGLPVVASRIGGITDIVEDGKTGLLVTPGDASELAAALRRLAQDRGLARRLGEAGRAVVEERFSWDAIVGAWDAVYRRVAALGRRPQGESGGPASAEARAAG